MDCRPRRLRPFVCPAIGAAFVGMPSANGTAAQIRRPIVKRLHHTDSRDEDDAVGPFAAIVPASPSTGVRPDVVVAPRPRYRGGPESVDGAPGGLAEQRLQFRNDLSMGLKSGL